MILWFCIYSCTSAELLTLWIATQSNHSKPLPFHRCQPAGEGAFCDFYHFSSACECSTSRILHIPKQRNRGQRYHIAQSCQSAGPKIEVLPEVLIQTLLWDMYTFHLSARRLHPCDIPVGCEQGELNIILQKENEAPGKLRDLPEVWASAHKTDNPTSCSYFMVLSI